MTGPVFRFLSLVNLAIASTALIFQVTVLYPWHTQLESEFQVLRKQHAEKLEEFHALKVSKLDGIEGSVLETRALLVRLLEREASSGSSGAVAKAGAISAGDKSKLVAALREAA